jgi:hypothetical protein
MLDSRQTVSEPQAKDVKVYSFAAKVRYPEDAENIQLQLSLSHEHRNKLTELVLANRKVYRQLVKNHCGVDLEALETQRDAILSEITELKTAINQWKMEERTRKTNPELATKLKELSAQLKPIREAIKEVKTRAKEDPELESALEQNEQDLKEEIKATRKHFSRERGIYWPNYMRNEEATNQARFQPFDPKFHRWTGEGSLAIQLQGGMSVPELFGGTDQRLRFYAPFEGFTQIDPKRTIRGPDRRVRVLYRAMSDDNKDPVWIELKVTMHRMLPPDARIKWALLTRKKNVRSEGKGFVSLTKDYDYSLQLVTETPRGPWDHTEPQKLFALKIGWSSAGGGLKVGSSLGYDGKRFDLYLPASWVEARHKVERLSSIIDLETNLAVEGLREAFPALFKGKPEELEVPLGDETVKILAQAQVLSDPGNQRSARRMANGLLKAYRFDPTMQPVLESWRAKHLHLLRFRRGLHENTLRARREIYRKFVAQMATRYAYCLFKDYDMRPMSRKNLTRDQEAQEVTWCRREVATSTLRSMLSQRFVCQLESDNPTLNAFLSSESERERPGDAQRGKPARKHGSLAA